MNNTTDNGLQGVKKAFFFARRAKQYLLKGQNPPQDLEISLHNGPYFQVLFKQRENLLITIYLILHYFFPTIFFVFSYLIKIFFGYNLKF